MMEFKSPKESNAFVKKYERLINRITNQFYSKVSTEWDTIYSMALEGFTLAINKYDESKSNMDFTQYAAYSMRNQILTSLDDELRTVRLSSYAQGVLAKRGEEHQFTSISLEVNDNDDESNTRSVNPIKNACIVPKWIDGDIYDYLYKRIEAKFKERDCEIFYMIFGLKDYDINKAVDVANHFNITEGRVSQCLKRIINYIRKDSELCEMLALLCE